MARAILLLLLAAAALAGCETAGKAEVVAYEPPSGGPVAELTVKTERIWLTNRVTMVLLRTGKAGDAPRKVQRVGQLQSGEYVKREVLSFDTRLPAGVPLWLHFEVRYDAGSLLETGCDFPPTVTRQPGARYLIDFIKTTNTCRPRLYVRGAGGTLQELPIEPV